MQALFKKIRIEDDERRHWVHQVLRERAMDVQRDAQAQASELQRQLSVVRQQQERLLNLRLLDEIEAETFAAKKGELASRAAKIKLQLDAVDRGKDENADIAVKAFELSQNLAPKWFRADTAAKRQILEIVCLNCRLVDVSLVPTIRKPFDVLAEGLLQKSGRGERI